MSIPATQAWRGQWIWSARSGVGAPAPDNPMNGALDPEYYDRRVLFRRSFELDEVPDEAPFRITADSRYVLYVNGVELSRGPVRHGQRELRYDHGDAAPVLRAGHNTVAVFARFYGGRTAWWLPTPTTFTLGGGSLVAELRVGQEWIATDDSWRYREATAWTPSRPLTTISPQIPEVFDARELDPQWASPEYDDGDWDAARVVASIHVGGIGRTRPPVDPYGAVLARPIPQLTAAPQDPETVSVTTVTSLAEPDLLEPAATRLTAALRETGENRTDPDAWHPGLTIPAGDHLLVVDFGKVVSGTVRFALTAEPGTTLIGALVETPKPAALASAQTFHYTARGRADAFEAHDPSGGRYLLLIGGAATLDDLAVVERLRPRPTGPYFACSDPLLNRVHATGLRTVDLTAHDAYIDCPTREQRAWTGDSVVHQSVDLVANPDWSLARWHPVLAARPRPDGLLPMVAAGDAADPGIVSIPDWSLHWMRSVHNLYRYTGDADLVGALLPTAENVLRWFTSFLGRDGLLHDVTGWVLVDWSPVPVSATSAALNALFARALADFAEMADWLGDSGRARWAWTLHTKLAQGFEVFWDEERWAYRDQMVDGVVQPSVSEHTTAAAVCAEIVPTERHVRLRTFLLNRSPMFTRSPVAAHGSDADGAPAAAAMFAAPIPDWDTAQLVVGAQPFFRYVVHDALALLGAADRLPDLCRDWGKLLDAGPTALRETWEGGSACHGWSATPSRDLLVYVLGITPAEPGYARVRIAPRLGDLEWARGAVPTPHGLLEVRVDDLSVLVDSPVPVDLSLREDQPSISLPPGRRMVPLT
ncbi:alpha-L-rhamnosidase N-terminal domain-containing protein [Catenulispora sp. NL8]|uniref:Alpha-L-rhamnosidase N-terminal domain-containing protein n=1 Tax=Catenulispora pinistramenti TaxID=2705254 RepID=A0ABS5KQ12_9ACTN|nr:alpha-L-rhamnosidase N-terminal domain-containing protein [Catenulispora pinistramenti]MBS2548129.1 alpha-L-rhamnosidase N-terminal domain-containing protein [Catenulispora pinistramenti]